MVLTQLCRTRPRPSAGWRALATASGPQYGGSDSSSGLGIRDERLLRVYLTACNHQWHALPAAGREALDGGCSRAELRATVRHMPM